jgi:hypothetical protein
MLGGVIERPRLRCYPVNRVHVHVDIKLLAITHCVDCLALMLNVRHTQFPVIEEVARMVNYLRP